jgi:YidC/Oxa1 family membrane protein insertase
MEKRIFLAILISLGLLWGWAALAPKLFPELARKPAVTKPAAPAPKPAAATTSTTGSAPAPAATAPTATLAAAPTTAPVAGVREQHTVVDTPEYRAVLTNRGAQLISFKLKSYLHKKSKQPEELVKAREPNRTDYPFTIVPGDRSLLALNSALYSVSDDVQANGERVVEYRYSNGHVTATKTFRFAKKPYLFDFAIHVTPPAPYRISVGPGIRTLGAQEQDTQVVTTGNGIYQAEGKFKIVRREKAPTVQSVPAVDYIGIEDNYFLTALRPRHAGEGVLQRVDFFNSKDRRRAARMSTPASMRRATDRSRARRSSDRKRRRSSISTTWARRCSSAGSA